MATAPAKPPLHNFPLSFLKWGSSNNKNHRYRRHVTTSAEGSQSPPPSSQLERGVGSHAAHHRFSLASCSSEKLPHNSDKPNEETDGEDEEEEEEEAKPVPPAAAEEEEEAAEEEVQKPWNLRPRRAAPLTSMMTSAKGNHNGGGEVHEAKSMRLRGMAAAAAAADGGGARSDEKAKEKRKFWIALSKDEVEEDIFVMTGSRPARRPKKRPRNVQKQLDNCFPGLWLVGYSADAYRASDSPTKK